jgi:integrase
VRRWHADTGTAAPTARAHAYALLRTILGTAVGDDLLPANPCRIRAAGTTKRARRIRPASLPELAALVEAMPARYRTMTLLAAWTGLRFGELTELRRADIDAKNGTIRVRRAVAWVDGKPVVGVPKSDASIRDVAIPPHLMPAVKDHLRATIAGGKNGLLFPAADGVGHLSASTLHGVFDAARVKAGRPDLRWHDLRHTSAVLAATSGASLAELMHRMGHSTPSAAMVYQHAAQGRDAVIAQALSDLARRAEA